MILITAWGSIQLAVEGMKAGAADFVTKPWTNAQHLQTVQTALGLAASAAAVGGQSRARGAGRAYDFGLLIGDDPRLRRLLQLIGRVAPTDAVGADHGRERHRQGAGGRSHPSQQPPRAAGPFVKVNLGGISSTLFESEMFGHVRGAFTDAEQDRKGRFELAHGGTIFLDEIGDLDPASQVKMLRVLQDRSFEVLG